jgi:hypothetical protein
VVAAETAAPRLHTWDRGGSPHSHFGSRKWCALSAICPSWRCSCTRSSPGEEHASRSRAPWNPRGAPPRPAQFNHTLHTRSLLPPSHPLPLPHTPFPPLSLSQVQCVAAQGVVQAGRGHDDGGAVPGDGEGRRLPGVVVSGGRGQGGTTQGSRGSSTGVHAIVIPPRRGGEGSRNILRRRGEGVKGGGGGGRLGTAGQRVGEGRPKKNRPFFCLLHSKAISSPQKPYHPNRFTVRRRPPPPHC